MNYTGKAIGYLKLGGYYDGEWKNGLMHGQGSHKCEDGCAYAGDFKFGKFKVNDKTDVLLSN